MQDAFVPPVFEPEIYFDRTLNATGVFIDRFGDVRRQFSVVVRGHKTASGFELDEAFVYDDGETETRRWDIVKETDEHYRGTCNDIVGVARGRLVGNMLAWRYRIRLAMFGRKVTVGFDDVMLLQSDDVLVNRAIVTKWGIKLGEVLITFLPES